MERLSQDRTRRGARALGASALSFAMVACGSGLRTVPRGPASGNASPIVVEYPPPPAQVEQIPPDPGKPCAWQDGHWNWAGRRWQWTDGQWVIAPKGCHYVDPWMSWVPAHQGNELHYWPPRWVADSGSTPNCQQPVSCSARSPAAPAR